MYRDQRIAVVIPARDEAPRLGAVIRGVPAWVDHVIVVDDGSTDGTAAEVRAAARSDARVSLEQHPASQGVGAAIATGYRVALVLDCDVAAVMAGDGQMAPDDLQAVVHPVATDQCDYCKGNRFLPADALPQIPAVRRYGSFLLSALTKVASGYYHVSDPQCGFTAMGRDALESVGAAGFYPRYGYPNDLLARLNVAEMRVAEVPVRPVYRQDGRSQMRLHRVSFTILGVLVAAFFRRLWRKHVLSSGHPLVFAYGASLLAALGTTGLGVYLAAQYARTGWVMKAALIVACALGALSVQLLMTALGMDHEASRHLAVHLRRAPHRHRAALPAPASETGSDARAPTQELPRRGAEPGAGAGPRTS
jgi:glycosyltransferase involved in cell wall biosynthesis